MAYAAGCVREQEAVCTRMDENPVFLYHRMLVVMALNKSL